MKIEQPVIVALDFKTETDAFALIEQCDPALCRVKIGKGMFTRFGPRFVRQVVSQGYDVFLDLKFHDIPNTVYDACRAAVDMGVWMINVHTLGGEAMLLKAREAVNGSACALVGVTILTSFAEQDLGPIGIHLPLAEEVLKLATLAHQTGLNGVVASSHEAASIKAHFGKSFVVVAPGIRLANDLKHDQQRTMSPSQAMRAGVDYLVIGRSICHAPQPGEVLKQINIDIKQSIME